jgi:hypothetical protein
MKRGRSLVMISILVVVHAVCGKGEEEAWLRGAHISPVSHPHSTERL